MTSLIFLNVSHTRGVHCCGKDCNRPGKLSPQGKFMGWNITPITPNMPTTGGGIPTKFGPTSICWHTGGWHQIKGISDGCFHLQHHYPHYWWHNLGGECQKYSIIGNIYHIPETSVLRTAETGPPKFAPEIIRRGLPHRTQDTYVLGHTKFLSIGITTQIKRNVLGTGHQGIPILDKNTYRQTGLSSASSIMLHISYLLQGNYWPDYSTCWKGVRNGSHNFSNPDMDRTTTSG